jgi:hypothetical protein
MGASRYKVMVPADLGQYLLKVSYKGRRRLKMLVDVMQDSGPVQPLFYAFDDPEGPLFQTALDDEWALREYRQLYHWEPAELGAHLGTGENRIKELECTPDTIMPRMAKRLAAIFGVPATRFLKMVPGTI